MGDVSKGSETSISYNPDNPAEAFITKNKGFLISLGISHFIMVPININIKHSEVDKKGGCYGVKK